MEIREIRRYLHKHPELSGYERNTSEFILNILRQMNADKIIEGIGGCGILALFKGNEQSSSILMRCDMDAVPVREDNTFDYASMQDNVSHACGHDGHMAIMTGLASRLSENRAVNNVYILFQPSEENGQGAQRILDDSEFPAGDIDYTFALHNLPGYPESSIIARQGVFAYASTGIEITLEGESSHAAYPEKGKSPVNALTEMLQHIKEITYHYRKLGADVTVISVNAGSRAFGTSPSDANVLLTVRSPEHCMIETMKDDIRRISSEVAEDEGLKLTYHAFEYFPECRNSNLAVSMIKQAACKAGLDYINLDEPMRWSEDFSRFLMHYDGAITGIGIGEDAMPLHSSLYDFNDSVIEPAINFLFDLISEIK